VGFHVKERCIINAFYRKSANFYLFFFLFPTKFDDYWQIFGKMLGFLKFLC